MHTDQPLMDALNALSENKRAMRKDWIDPDDAPELTDAFFERTDEHRGEILVRRGRPPAEATK